MTSSDNLYKYLGISDERFQYRITPFMDKLIGKGGPLDLMLLAVEQNHDLHEGEKIYCAFCIGRCAATAEIDNKTGGLAKRFGLLH